MAYETKRTFYITVVMCRLNLFLPRFLPNLFLKQTESLRRKHCQDQHGNYFFLFFFKSDLRIGVKNVSLIEWADGWKKRTLNKTFLFSVYCCLLITVLRMILEHSHRGSQSRSSPPTPTIPLGYPEQSTGLSYIYLLNMDLQKMYCQEYK